MVNLLTQTALHILHYQRFYVRWYLLTLMELNKMSEQKMSEIDRSSLVDIRDVIVDPKLPWLQRMESYLEQIKNPYCYLYDGIVVQVRFTNGGPHLKNSLKNYLIRMKKS